jgi:hypothetical protein
MRRGLVLGLLSLAAVFVVAGLHFQRVRKPPVPPAAKLPGSARILLLPFRKDTVDLTVASQGELDYRIGMQAGATLVYAWSTPSPGDTLSCEFAGQQMSGASAVHKAFVAQSAGWYHWRWKNPNSRPVNIHFKLSGFYEPPAIPPGGPQ